VKQLNIAFSVAAFACLVTVACSGGSGGSSGTPTTPTPPTTPTTPTNNWTINGTVTDTVSGAPIGNASIAPSWNLAAVTAGGDGAFQLGSPANPPTTPYDLTVSAGGFLTRKQWVTWQQGQRNGISLDLIRLSAPFSMDFYKQLVRGTFDYETDVWPVLRLNASPKFYVKTVEPSGRSVEPEVLSVVLAALQRAVPAFTGGKLSAAAIETGTETRGDVPGWINVLIVREPASDSCGLAYIGREAGEITLNNDLCGCGSNKIPGELVMHEVGHALGFFHVNDTNSVMNPTSPIRCGAVDLSPAERYHSAIAYSRPRGNTDPDQDPSSGRLSSAGVAGPGIRIKN
jgi:hypothetical protein